MKRLWRLVRRLWWHTGRIAGRIPWRLLAGPASLLLLVATLLVVLVYLPPAAVDHHGLTGEQWSTHVDNLRGQILQGLGGLAVLGSVYVGVRTFLLNRRGQLIERFSKAGEQLGAESLAGRLVGIYALEQIAREYAQLHWPVMEVLTAYLREHSPASASARTAAPADHQAIATVIGRRRIERDPAHQWLDLRKTNLTEVNWRAAHLRGAKLREARLDRANLSGANLNRADLTGASLEGAHLGVALLRGAALDRARLEGANLNGAHLREAHLHQAHLERADLLGADLDRAFCGEAHLKDAILRTAHLAGATFRDAHLEGVDLRHARLEGADFRGAHLKDADLHGAHLEGARLRDAHGLTRQQLEGAVDTDNAQLPEGLARPPVSGAQGPPELSGVRPPEASTDQPS